jgi:hypothetical protein
MSPSSITGTTVILKSGYTDVSKQLSLSSDGMTVTLSADLAFSTAYTLSVAGGSSGVKDMAGNAMESDYSVSFTTEDKPDSGGGGGGGGCFISASRF